MTSLMLVTILLFLGALAALTIAITNEMKRFGDCKLSKETFEGMTDSEIEDLIEELTHNQKWDEYLAAAQFELERRAK